ncbi:hypothetical protein FJZ17_00150 [Candidatus Pacearchaeota archaeon]|nr:hypothetical protein [Candidatus Pacearchaeota archaeon]
MRNNYVLPYPPFEPFDRDEHVVRGLKALGDVPCRARMPTEAEVQQALLEGAEREAERLRRLGMGRFLVGVLNRSPKALSKEPLFIEGRGYWPPASASS